MKNKNNFEISFTKNNVKTDIKLNDTEFKVLNLAVNHNHGIINLLGHMEEIKTLFNMGFLTIENELLTVKKEFIPLLQNYQKKDKWDLFCGICKNNITLIERL